MLGGSVAPERGSLTRIDSRVVPHGWHPLLICHRDFPVSDVRPLRCGAGITRCRCQSGRRDICEILVCPFLGLLFICSTSPLVRSIDTRSRRYQPSSRKFLLVSEYFLGHSRSAILRHFSIFESNTMLNYYCTYPYSQGGTQAPIDAWQVPAERWSTARWWRRYSRRSAPSPVGAVLPSMNRREQLPYSARTTPAPPDLC